MENKGGEKFIGCDAMTRIDLFFFNIIIYRIDLCR